MFKTVTQVLLAFVSVLSVDPAFAQSSKARICQIQADVRHLVSRAKDAIEHEQLAHGEAYLKAAIQLLGEYRPIVVNPPKHALSQEDVEYGKRQFDAFVKDRPIVRDVLDKSEFQDLREWAIRQFAGEFSGGRVKWSGRTSHMGYNNVGKCAPKTGDDGSIKTIYVSGTLWKHGKNRDENILTYIGAEHVWSVLIYELHNIVDTKEYYRLRRDASARRISPEEYVRRLVELELPAVAMTLHHYAHMYLPRARRSGTKTAPVYWYLDDLVSAIDGAEVLRTHPKDREQWPWSMKPDYRFRKISEK